MSPGTPAQSDRRDATRLDRATIAISVIAICLAVTGGAAVASHLVVRTSDIAANAVNGAKVDNGTITGKDVKERALGTVPRAGRVDEASVKRFKKKTGVTGQTSLARLGSLRLRYACVQSGISPVAEIDALSTVDDARIQLGMIRGPDGGGEAFWNDDSDLDRGESFSLDHGTGAGSVRFHYSAPNGSRIGGSLDFTATGSACIAQGVLIGA